MGMRFVLGGNENGLELDRVEIVAQPHEYTVNHRTVHIQWVRHSPFCR